MVQNEVNKNVREYVKNNLVTIMKEQEEKLGIKHFGIPRIEYKKDIVTASYDRLTDIICLPTKFTVTQENSLTNKLSNALTFNSSNEIKKDLDHELGHYYVDKLNQSLGLGDWPNYYSITDEQMLSNRTIGEGIAQYFMIKMNNLPDTFTVIWPKTIDSYTESFCYGGGYKLVKPILDKYGKKGIECLIKNPINKEELTNLNKYQNRILRILETN